MSKRSRTESGMYSRQATAAAINAAVSRRYPYSDYGRVMHKRGTSAGMAKYGSTYSSASLEQRLARKADGYYGRGMYTGRGMYSGATNELMAGSDNKSPSFMSVPDESGSLIVSHREYIGDIFAPSAGEQSQFTVQGFPINPGLEQSFPWLSQIAQNYEEYELIQCVYEFQSTVQDITSANGQVGTIIAATQYNSSLADFTDKPAMQAYAHSVSGKSTDDLKSGVECDPSKISGSTGKYIRANPTVQNEDLKTYDHGRFQLATHNLPLSMASGTLGELYCAYTIKLRKPKFFTGRGLGITSWQAFASGAVPGTDKPSWPMSNQVLYNIQNNLAVQLLTGNTSSRTGLAPLPAGFTSVQDIVIPAYFAGNLEIVIALERTDGSGAFTNDSNKVCQLGIVGNIALVPDLWPSEPGNANTFGSSVKLVDLGKARFTYHLRVDPSTNAQNNVISLFSDVDTGNSGAITGTYSSSIVISEYNTFGVQGQPTLATGAGVIQEIII